MVAFNSHLISDANAERLLKVLDKHSAAQKLTDLQLADVATNIWGRLIPGSDEEIMLNELIERFERMTGIKRDEETREGYHENAFCRDPIFERTRMLDLLAQEYRWRTRRAGFD